MAKRICKVCGAEYSYCPRCEEDEFKPTWMLMFDTDNCRKIFDTMQRHFVGEYDDAKTLKILDSCDLSQINNFQKNIKKDINEVLAIRKKEHNKYTKIVNKKNENS